MSLQGNATAEVVLRGTINNLDTLVIDAYDIAVKNGFDGTEEEWLASLHGRDGVDGEKGEKGDKGDTGDVADITYNKPTGTNLLDVDAIIANPEHGGMWDDTTPPWMTGYIPVQAGDVLSYQQCPDDVSDIALTAGVVAYAYYYDANWESEGGVPISTATFTVPDIDGVSYVRLALTIAPVEPGNYACEQAIVRGAEVVDGAEFTSTPVIRPDYLPEVGGSVEGAVLYTEQVLTEEQKAQARENIGAAITDNDVEYIPSGNLYNGEWEVGKYNLTTGAKQSSTNHVRNIKPIALDATKRYNIAIKVGYSTTLYLLKYDSDMNFLGKVQRGISSNVHHVHFENTAYINFYLQDWVTNYPDEKPQVMVYESELDAPPTEWQEYGASEQYYKNNLLVRGEQIVGGVPSADITLAIDKARFDGRFNYVAYSTIGGIGKDINSREFFAWAAKQDFTALKGDIEITADGKLIMCHDAGFTLDDNGKITTYDSTNATAIHDMTEAECLALQHARYSGYVCGFDEYVRICKKYGKIAYITVRNHYVDEYVPELLRVLRKYGMVKQCIISAYPHIDPLYAVRAADPTIMLAYVLGKNANITTAHIDLAVSMGNMLISGFHFSSATDDVATKLAGSIAAIEYAHEKDVRVYEGQVHNMEIADTLMEYGITGAQIMFNPSFE